MIPDDNSKFPVSEAQVNGDINFIGSGLFVEKCHQVISAAENKTKDASFRIRFVEKVCEILECEPDQVLDSTDFMKDLGADSLDLVELVMEMQEEFRIEIPDEVAEKCPTVETSILAIKQLLNATYGQVGQPTSVPVTTAECPCPTDQSCICDNTRTNPNYKEGYDLGFRNDENASSRRTSLKLPNSSTLTIMPIPICWVTTKAIGLVARITNKFKVFSQSGNI